MNISQLIQSTNSVKNRDQGTVFTSKKFGTIYAYNQTVKTRKGSSIVEVTMMIGALSDMIRTSRVGSRPVAAHKVMISIRGVKHTFYTADQLVSIIRFRFKEYSDAEEFPASDILKMAVENQIRFFENSTIFATSDGEGYNVIEDNIPEDSDIRVWCSCSDYYWTFQFYNVENGVDIWGKYPDRYVPKTKKGFEAFRKNQPLRNPGRNPGMCKHLMLLLSMLMDRGVVQDSNGVLKSYFKADFSRFKKKDRLSQDEYNRLLKKYQTDHNAKNMQRSMNRGSIGYGTLAGFKKGGWDSKTHEWKAGKWVQRRPK